MRTSFRLFLSDYKIYIRSALAMTVFFITVFKLIYPYPNMVLDSYYYILGAISHADVGAWAIGYSWFLRGFGFFSHSALLLVIFQYLFLECALLVLFITVTKFLRLSARSKWVLFVPLFVNPLLLYCANFIMADSLFITLSALWISVVLLMIHRPRAYLVWVHAALLLSVFTVRYNALYYPVIATIGLLISGFSWPQKILGIVLQVIFIGAFISYTSMRIGAISGQPQFSPFGNWKTANDALYMYGHIYHKDKSPVPAKFSELDRTVRTQFDSNGRVDDLLDYTSHFYGSVYMFYYTSPLVKYKNLLYGEDTELVNFRKMAYLGPLYGQYGSYLIQKHPVAFIRYFVCPNAVRYFYPPMEAFTSFPPFFLRTDYLGQAARQWFGVNTLTVNRTYINLRTEVLAPYQALTAAIHLLFMLSILGVLTSKGLKISARVEKYTLLILIVLWISDLLFNLTAAATVMRYLIFPLSIELSMLLWLSEQIYASDKVIGK